MKEESINPRIRLAKVYESFLLNRVDKSVVESFRQLKSTSDETVLHACEIIEDISEGVENDPRALNHAEVKYIERVRLAILSEKEIIREDKIEYGVSNFLSLCAFLGYSLLVFLLGFSLLLVPLSVAAGATSLALGNLMTLRSRVLRTSSDKINPFMTFSQLAQTRRSTRGFKKIRTSVHCMGRKNDQSHSFILTLFLLAAIWPVTLFFLMIPIRSRIYRVI